MTVDRAALRRRRGGSVEPGVAIGGSVSHAPLDGAGSRLTASAVGGRPASMADQVAPALDVRGEVELGGRPGGAQLELGAVALPGEFAEAGREHLRRGAGRGSRSRAPRASSASISHDHATSATNGSRPMSVSSGAWAKQTTRNAPPQASGSSGS